MFGGRSVVGRYIGKLDVGLFEEVSERDFTVCGGAAWVATGFTDGGTTVYVTTSTDNVGIGTFEASNQLSIKQPPSTSQDQVMLGIHSGSWVIGDDSGLAWKDSGGVTSAIRTGPSASGDWDMKFYTTTTGGGFSAERMRIGHNGNIGIGTVNIEDAIVTIGRKTFTAADTTPALSLGAIAGSTATGLVKLQVYDDNGVSNPWGLGVSSQQMNYIVGTGTNSHVFHATGTGVGEIMRIDGMGNVGIGTHTFTSKFAVAGNVGIGTNRNSTYLRTAPPSGGIITEGNIGVGSLTPGTKLDVQGAIRASTGFQYGANVGIGTTGADCTITQIEGGIITAATCS